MRVRHTVFQAEDVAPDRSLERGRLEDSMRRVISLGAVMAMMTIGLAVAASTQQTTPQAPKPTIRHEPAKPINSLEGKDTFAAYCAVCHGKDAKGHGPAAPALKAPPADLTTIAKRHNGKFSSVDVETKISGNDLPVHGTSEMPIWGPEFRSISKDRDVGTMRMKNLVRYLESIQEK
jgi:mono/diheme cytochrome c family protein